MARRYTSPSCSPRVLESLALSYVDPRPKLRVEIRTRGGDSVSTIREFELPRIPADRFRQMVEQIWGPEGDTPTVPVIRWDGGRVFRIVILVLVTVLLGMLILSLIVY